MASYIQAVRFCFTSTHSPAGKSAIPPFLTLSHSGLHRLPDSGTMKAS